MIEPYYCIGNIAFAGDGVWNFKPYSEEPEPSYYHAANLRYWLLAYATRRMKRLVRSLEEHISEATVVTNRKIVWENGSFETYKYRVLEEFVNTSAMQLKGVVLQQIIIDHMENGSFFSRQEIGDDLFKKIHSGPIKPSGIGDVLMNILLTCLDEHELEEWIL